LGATVKKSQKLNKEAMKGGGSKLPANPLIAMERVGHSTVRRSFATFYGLTELDRQSQSLLKESADRDR